MNGIVETLKQTYGFIRGEDGVCRFFIPSLMVDPIAFDELAVGTIVTFEHVDGDKGPRAVNVEPVSVAEE